MGKSKSVDTTAVKAGTALIEIEEKKGIKKDAAKSERKSEDKNDVPKDGGAKPAKKSQTFEIDDIFSAGKKKAAEGKRSAVDGVAQEPEGAVAAAAAAAPAKRQRVAGSKDDIFGETTGKGRKRTEEGYPIYTEDELGLGKKGGDTDLCPFDCDCCF